MKPFYILFQFNFGFSLECYRAIAVSDGSSRESLGIAASRLIIFIQKWVNKMRHKLLLLSMAASLLFSATAQAQQNQGKSANSIENLLSTENPLEFQSELAGQRGTNPVEQIFAIFESKGHDAALTRYAQLSSDHSLDKVARTTLAAAANEQGLAEVAKLIIAHANS